MKIRSKIIFVLLTVSLIPIVISGTILSFYEREGDTRQIIKHLESVASIQHTRILGIHEQNLERLQLVASRTQLRISLNGFNISRDDIYRDKMNRILADAKKSIPDFNDIFIYTLDGTVVASTDSNNIGFSFPDDEAFLTGLNKNQAGIFTLDSHRNLELLISGPLYLENKLIGVLVISSKTNNLLSSISDYTGLGETGETILASRNELGDAVFVTPLRFNQNATLNLIIEKTSRNIPVTRAMNGEEEVFINLVDYRDQPVLSVTRYISEADWGLVVKIDKAEAFSHIKEMQHILIKIIAASFFVIIFISIWLSRIITSPITLLTNIAQQIADGNHHIKANESSNDETGILGHAFNMMTTSLVQMKASLEGKVEELQKTTLFLENVLDSTPDLIFVKNKKLQTILCNKSYSMAVGKTPEEMYGHTDIENGWDPELVKGNSAKGIRGFEQDDRDALAGKAIHNPHDPANINGEIHFFDTHKVPLHNSKGEIIGILGVARDSTQRLQTEEKISRQEEQLRRSQKMNALGKLTGGVAHDYNNMLGIIMGYATLLESALNNQPGLAKYAQEILRAGERGAKLTQKLLAFSRQGMANAEALNLNSLLLQEQHMLEKTLTARIQLKLELADDLWPVCLDSGDLEDTIVNISINAMHAMDNGGQLTIQTTNKTIAEIDTDTMDINAGDYVVLSITDTGHGIDDATIENIFDPFYTTKGEKGTGLGLSQVYGFIERSNGAIKVYSELDHGAQFVMYFPRHHGHEGDRGKDGAIAAGNEVDLTGTETILVVDDEPALLDLSTEILGQEGYTILQAGDGQQALAILKKESVDLILSDIVMPKMDGYELATLAQEQYPDIKIQLVSGFDDSQIPNEANKILQKNLLRKPYKSQDLLKKIRALLDKQSL